MNRPPVRIVLAMDPASPGTTVQHLLEALAAIERIQLIGIFVESSHILAHARSSLAREVVVSGGFRQLQVATLERQIRLSSSTMRKNFETVARKLGVPHDFRVSRGDVVAEIEHAARDADLLIVGLAPQAIGSRAWWGAAIHDLARSRLPAVLFVRGEEPADNRPLLVVLDREEEVGNVLEQANRLARVLGSPVIAAVVVGDSGLGERIQARVKSFPSARPVEALGFSLQTPEHLARLASSRNAAAVVLAADDPRSDAEFVREVLRRTRCALMLVNPELNATWG